MAKFPEEAFGPHAVDVPWTRLATIREHLEDGEPLPSYLARWLATAIAAADGSADKLVRSLGLVKTQGRPSAWDDAKAEQALRWLYELTTAGCVSDKDAPKELRCPSERKSLPSLTDEAAILKVQQYFLTADGQKDRFPRSTMQRWLAAVRLAEHEAGDSTEEDNA